jgi:large subunit ribosomal protein L25
VKTIIKAQKRKKVRKKVKDLLREGFTPAVVYGPKRDSINVKVDVSDFKKVFKNAGYSKVADFEIEGEKKGTKVIVREVQLDPVTSEILHVSFYEPDLSKQITTEVPIVTRGTSKIVEEKTGFLVTPLDSLEVRCLPENLPSEIVIDISGLENIGDSIPLGELVLPQGVELVGEAHLSATVAYIAPPQKEIVEEEKPEVEVEEEVVEGEEEAEGEEVVEGEEAEKAEEGEEEGDASTVPTKGEEKDEKKEQNK